MGRKRTKETVYFAFTQGGLGDFIARLPAIKYVLDNYKHVTLHIIAQEYQVPILNHVFPNLYVSTFEQFNSIKRIRPVNIIKSDIKEHTIIRTNLVDHAFNTLLDYHPYGIEHRNYIRIPVNNVDITKFNLPDKYVVIPLMFTTKVREFPPRIINDIVNYIKSKGYAPVFLGSEKAKANEVHTIEAETRADRSQGIDLINQTTLLEATKILGNASCVVTLDSGLGHLAACTDVPIVIGYTTVEPHHRTPQRHNIDSWKVKSVVPPKSLRCRFCQSKMNFTYDHDFRECYHGHLNCIKRMKSTSFIKAINDVLHNKWENTIYE